MRSTIMRRRMARVASGILLTLVVSLGGCGLVAQQPPARQTPSPPSTAPGGTQGSALADTPGTTLALNGADVTVGASTHLAFTGNGFAPDEALAVSITDAKGKTEMQLPPVNANTNGEITSGSVMVPADLAPGTHALVVTGQTSQHTAHATFQVQRVPPAIRLDAYTGPPGYVFGVSGSGFASNEKVDVFIGTMKGPALATLTTGEGGRLMGSVTVPERPKGDYTLYFVGRVSATSTSVGFSIQGFKPWVTLETYAPAVGATLRASGHDFASGEKVLVYLNTASGKPLTTVQAGNQGEFSNASVMEISDQLTGHQTLIFVGEKSRVSTQTAFDVFPAPSSK